MGRPNRNAFFVIILTIFVVVSLYLYSNIDLDSQSGSVVRRSEQIEELRKQLLELQNDVKRNDEEMRRIQKEIAYSESKREQLNKQIEKENEVYDVKAEAEKALEKSINQIEGDANHKAVEEEQRGVGPEPLRGNKVAVVHNLFKQTTPHISSICQRGNNFSDVKSDIQMLDVYDLISFNNTDGGVWKQGWELTYDANKVSNGKRLEVIVIPHSHCDPGWIKTFEDYYASQTRNILDGMVKHLENKKDMRFIFAEMSFFEMWWRDQSEATKIKVKKYISTGQFEIVTGGWVMTDEANSHYYSMITELIEGHEWIRNHIGEDFSPRSHWSIDPFGLSPSLPYLLSAANITNAAIQRVHYSVKKHLAKSSQLEFMWRQLWGFHGHADVRTHLFPFYSYDVPHTCGPDPKICCQFDFRRLPGGGHSCPWNIPPQKISQNNVKDRAFMLYDQYRKKSQLYRTNVLLIPLGDDFRYDIDFEWDEQYSNYKILFDYINKQKEWNVQARFGTLSDYFDLLGKNLEEENITLPVLSGDFFTYADRDDHYWSGYFTSRPFYKQLDRVLQHHLRASEIAYSLNSIKNGIANKEVFPNLISARRALSLFQHHDGVTGTAKDHVMMDYGNKMIAALQSTEKVLAASISSILGYSGSLLLDEYRMQHDTLPQNRKYKIGDSVILFNTLHRNRSEPACIRVDSIEARLKGEKTITQQVSPVFILNEGKIIPKYAEYELCFIPSAGPFGVLTYKVVKSTSNDLASFASLSGKQYTTVSDFNYKLITGDIFVLSTELISVMFNSTNGFLKSVTITGHTTVDINMHYVYYGARSHKRMNNGGGDDLSGAYLFLPDGEAKILSDDIQDFMVVDGPLIKKVFVAGPKELQILQTYTIVRGEYSVQIENQVDIRKMSNFELAMRINSSIASGENLYTDLNGLQLIRRRRILSKLPLQAHFYPMPASAFIEDENTRISLLGAQALGVASLKEGQIDVMLDRRLNQDDGRGLFQGVLDNHRTISHFRLLVEPLNGPPVDSKARVGFNSAIAHAASMEIHYPWIKMIANSSSLPFFVTGLNEDLPCHVHVVTMRTLAGPTDYSRSDFVIPKKETALILYRPLFDCRSKLQLDGRCSTNEKIFPKSILPSVISARASSLTLLYEGSLIDSVTMNPQDLKTIKLLW